MGPRVDIPTMSNHDIIVILFKVWDRQGEGAPLPTEIETEVTG